MQKHKHKGGTIMRQKKALFTLALAMCLCMGLATA